MPGVPTIPGSPEIPEIPDLGKPDDKAKFRTVVEGAQYSEATVTGAAAFGNCTFEFNVVNNEIWSFARGKGVTMVFERFGRIVLMHRKGHPPGDTTLALVGTVSRTASGGYNEQGPPPCRGAFPSNQTNCNTDFPVNSPLALYLSNKRELSLDRTASQELIPNDDSESPAHLCGIDDQHPDTAWFLYSFPFLLETELGELKKRELFGKKHAIVERGDDHYFHTSQPPYVNTETTDTDVTVRFIRLGD